MAIAWPVFALTLVLQAVRGECVSILLLSEGEVFDPELQAIRRFFVDSKADFKLEHHLPPVSPGTVGSTRRAFDLMAYADILVAATSGFSRLAAVLSRNIRLAPDPVPSHPLSNISDNIILVPRRDLFWTSAQATHDSALQDLAREAAAAAERELDLLRLLRDRLPILKSIHEHPHCLRAA